MDDRRFDDLTRRLAHGVSRRAAMKGGVAALLGAFGLRGHAAAQVSQAHAATLLRREPGGCKPGCVCCVYANGNSRCRPPGTCAPGQEVPPTTPPPRPPRRRRRPQPRRRPPRRPPRPGRLSRAGPWTAAIRPRTASPEPITIRSYSSMMVGSCRWRHAARPVAKERSRIPSSSCTPARAIRLLCAHPLHRTTTAAVAPMHTSKPSCRRAPTP